MSVLILESDDRHLAYVTAALTALGRPFERCRSFSAITEAATRCSLRGSASLLLVDHALIPDGQLEHLLSLVRVSAGAPVALVLSGVSMPIAVRAGRMGAREVVPKPVCRGTLEALLFPERASSSELRATSIDELEQNHIQLALARCEGNISLAAKQLGIERRSLQRKLQRMGHPSRGGGGGRK